MISMWVFAGCTPFFASSFVSIYNEFDLDLPAATELTIALFDWPSLLRWAWCPIALAFGIVALLVPEIFFTRSASSGPLSPK